MSKSNKILLIEDNPDDADLFLQLLAEVPAADFEVRHCERLGEALAQLVAESFDAVFLDLGLPDSQGLETFFRIRNRFPGVPVLVLTGLDDQGLGVTALQEGAQEYLVKRQVNGEILVRAARYAIERMRIKEALRRAHDELESRVQERTAELTEANERLRVEIRERLSAEQSVRRKSEILDAINKFFLETFTVQGIEELSSKCIDAAGKLTGCEFGFVGIVNENGRFDTLGYSGVVWGECGMPRAEAIKLSTDMEIRGIWGRALRDGKSLITNDPASHPDSIGTPEGHPVISSFLGVPLKQAGGTIGMIGLANKKNGYDTDDLEAVESLSAAFTIALNHKKAQILLNESELRYKNLLGAVTDYIYSVDIEDGRPVATTHSAGSIKVTGYTPEEFAKNPYLWLQIIYEKDRDAVLGHSNMLTTGKALSPIEHRIIHKDGSVRWVRNTTVGRYPEHEFHGELVGYDGMIEDITERIELEAQLYQSQKMETVGRLAGGVAHDFNNLLTVIMAYTGFVLKEVAYDPKLLQDLNEVVEAGKRAAALTRQLLAFSRKQVMEIRPVDLNNLIKNMAKMFGRLVEEDISIEIKAPSSPLQMVSGDPGQIEQVLMNLIVNARDAMPEGGKIVVRTTNFEMDDLFCAVNKGARPGHYVMFSVEDGGVGIPAEIQQKIFEPFFTTKGREKGTGLGLSTVYGIVKQLDGYITLDSKVGAGSTFRIFLPVTSDKMQDSAETDSEDIGGNETILLVEDEPCMVNMLCRQMKTLGYKILSATDAEKAMEVSDRHEESIDLLLTDVILPGANGRELAEKITARRPGLKVLYMSGYTDDVITDKGVLLSDIKFIAKPFTMKKLAQKLREILDEEAKVNP